MKELKGLKDALESINNLETHFEDIETLIEMAEEEQDDSLIEEISESINTFTEEFENFRIETLLSEEFDANNAVITIHAGAGGTESCDWSEMLYRMYVRWAEKKAFPWRCLIFLTVTRQA